MRHFDQPENAIVMAGPAAADTPVAPARDLILRKATSPPKVLFVPLVGAIGPDA